MLHRVDDLRYRLLSGPTDLAPLKVLACRSLTWAGWEVRAYILGASHAVTFRRGGIERAELLTCLPPAGDYDAALDLRVPGLEAADETCLLPSEWLPGVFGGVVLSRFRLTERDDALIGGFTDADTLTWAFPPPPDARPDEPPPRTRVGCKATERGGLYIETVHTYPEEGYGVRSRTALCPEGDQVNR